MCHVYQPLVGRFVQRTMPASHIKLNSHSKDIIDIVTSSLPTTVGEFRLDGMN